MPPPVVDRYGRRWKHRIAKSADRDADPIAHAVFGMEQVAAADRAEAEHEARALIAGAPIFGRVPGDSIRCGEAREGGEDAAGTLLAREAMADADAERFAVELDAELTATAGSDSRGRGRVRHASRAGIRPIESCQASQPAAAKS